MNTTELHGISFYNKPVIVFRIQRIAIFINERVILYRNRFNMIIIFRFPGSCRRIEGNIAILYPLLLIESRKGVPY